MEDIKDSSEWNYDSRADAQSLFLAFVIFLVSSPVKRMQECPHNSVHVAQNRSIPSQSKTSTYMASANTSGLQFLTEQLHTQGVEHIHM